MENNLIIVTGYFGAPVYETARHIAESASAQLLVLDDEIVKRDGRSILRICMLEGEHSYRNKEYEVLRNLAADKFETHGKSDANSCSRTEQIVVACGDGVLHDEMSRDIALAGQLVIAGEDMSIDELWENARQDEGTYHAFMKFGTEEKKFENFKSLIQRQKILFDKVRSI